MLRRFGVWSPRTVPVGRRVDGVAAHFRNRGCRGERSRTIQKATFVPPRGRDPGSAPAPERPGRSSRTGWRSTRRSRWPRRPRRGPTRLAAPGLGRRPGRVAARRPARHDGDRGRRRRPVLGPGPARPLSRPGLVPRRDRRAAARRLHPGGLHLAAAVAGARPVRLARRRDRPVRDPRRPEPRDRRRARLLPRGRRRQEASPARAELPAPRRRRRRRQRPGSTARRPTGRAPSRKRSCNRSARAKPP